MNTIEIKPINFISSGRTNIPTTMVSNGLRIANFSSPHPFLFEDGNYLPACSDEWAIATMLITDEEEHLITINNIPVIDIIISFKTTELIRNILQAIEEDNTIDIVLVPLPVYTAIKNENLNYSKVRVIRVKNRITKEIYINKFCI